MNDKRFQKYRRKQTTWARPYEIGEDLTGISVSGRDLPNPGGLIGINPD